MSVIKGATIGMFDGVHLGHQYLISQLKEHCDEAVAVTFTNHPLGHKGRTGASAAVDAR